MNFNNVGEPIAMIEGIPKQRPVLSVAWGKDQNLLDFTLKNKDEKIQHIPTKTKARDVLYITGQSGSGKSYYTLMYCKEYLKMYPSRSVYLFSALQEDETLDKLKQLKRIALNGAFLQTQFVIDDFADSMVIFDDWDSVQNKLMKQKLDAIMHMILTTGRHSKTSCIVITHNATERERTKTILNECNSVTVFPLSTPPRTLHYLMYNYFGLEKEKVNHIKSLVKHSRWVTLCKTYPNIVLYEQGAYLLLPSDD